MHTRYEKDPEGHGPEMKFTTQLDEHLDHEVEVAETLLDNPLQGTCWGYCQTCESEFIWKDWTPRKWAS